METVFLLLFGIVLVGLTLFFINYKNSFEGFQVGSTIRPIESDKFLNNTLDPVTPTFTGFSTSIGIKNDFQYFITDWHNFSGFIDRGLIINEDRWETSRQPNIRSLTYSYINNFGEAKEENITDADLNVSTRLNNAGQYARFHIAFFYNALRRDNKDRWFQPQDTSGFADPFFNSGPSLPNRSESTYRENFTKFVNSVNREKERLTRVLLSRYRPWDLIGLSNVILYNNYTSSNLFNLTSRNMGLDINGRVFGGNVGGTVFADVGTFKRSYGNKNVSLTIAQNEQLKLYIYGTFCNYHSNDFRESLHWGSAFDFRETSILDIYLNIPYYDTLMNGSNVFYSYGHFFPEVKSKSSSEPFIFLPNEVTISNNSYLVNLRNPTSLRTPITLDPTIGYDGNLTIDSIRYGANQLLRDIQTTSNSLSALSLQQQYIGKIDPQALAKMPIMMRRFIISWAYNRTLRTLDSRLENENWDNDSVSYNINKGALLITLAYNNWSYFTSINNTKETATWSNYLTKYMYTGLTNVRSNNVGHSGSDINEIRDRKISNSVNPEINALATVVLFGNNATTKARGLTFRKSDSVYWGQRWTEATPPAIRNDNNYVFYSLTINNNPNLSYKTSGNTWDLNDATIQNMISDFKNNIYKLVPDYGIANNMNVLDQKMLDSIAQSFYEYSDGLFEINFIYDVYPIGSNMLDIRFDKKQRLGPASYITLRNQYQPKIIEYNNLVSMFEQNTWQDTYSNVNDLLSNISTIKTRDLEQVFNPVYTINNRNPDTIRTEINRISESNITLTNQISGVTRTVNNNLATTDRVAASNYINNLLNTPNSALVNVALLQQQIDSNNTLLNNLSNQLDGIETNVARIFYTMTNSSNLTINGVALGPNAALSYNPIYNAVLQADMGQSQGNVNYTPTILYTKNVRPVIEPNNIDFMKRVAQLYIDAVPISLSSFTRAIYPVDENGVLRNGFVRVDKIFGSAKINEETVGFRWQESQYDYFTNKPNVQRIVNVVLKFAFDNSEYQNPQIYIDNQVSNIYIDSNIFNSTKSNYILNNENTIRIYQSNIITLSNQISIQNDSNIISVKRGQISNYNISINNLININSNLNIINNSFKITTLKNNFDSNLSIYELYNYRTNIENLDSNIYIIGKMIDTLSNNVINSSNNLGSTINAFRNITIDGVAEFNRVITAERPNEYYPISISLMDFINRTTSKFFINPYFTNLYQSNYGTYENMYINQLTDYNNRNSSLTRALNSNYSSYINYSNYVIRILYSLEEDTLDNNDGACPANMVCSNPEVIKQLIEYYNLDSNNLNKILRVFKGFTPNPFRCDYSIEIANSNGQTQKGTIAFDVGQNIEDCTYFITSNHGFNKGYYIIDKLDYISDTSGVDISGFNYVSDALNTYNNRVKNIFNPLITATSNAISNMFNAIGESRLNTYDVLGKWNKLELNRCGTIDYNTLLNYMSNNYFTDPIFKSHPFFDSHIINIKRLSIFDSNKFDVIFDTVNLKLFNNEITPINSNTLGARFIVATSEMCDIYPVFMCNVAVYPISNTLDLSNKPFSANIATINDSISNINILNRYTYAANNIDVYNLDIKNRLSMNGNIIESYQRIDINKILYTTVKLNIRRQIVGGVLVNLSNYTSNYIMVDIGKTTNPIYIQSFYNYTTLNSNAILKYSEYEVIPYEFPTTEPCSITDSDTSIIFENNRYIFPGWALENLKNALNIRNIYSYKINNNNPSGQLIITSPFTVNLQIYNDYNLSIEKSFITVTMYYYNCSMIYIVNAVPTNINNINLFNIITPSINDINTINKVRNYYNSVFNPNQLSRFYNGQINSDGSITYAVSIYYKKDTNNYNFNIVPNDIWTTLKYIKVYFVQFGTSTDYRILKFEITNNTSLNTPINDTNQIVQSNREYFIKNFKYTSFRFKVLFENDSQRFQISQIELFSNIYSVNLSNVNFYYVNNEGNNVYPIEEYTYENTEESVIDENGITSESFQNLRNMQFLINKDVLTSSNPQIYEFNNSIFPIIELRLQNGINADGYSITSGSSYDRAPRNWEIYGSTDNNYFILLNSKVNFGNNISYPRAFYRTPIISFVNDSNIPLVQPNIYQKSILECGINPLDSNNFINYFPFLIEIYNADGDYDINRTSFNDIIRNIDDITNAYDINYIEAYRIDNINNKIEYIYNYYNFDVNNFMTAERSNIKGVLSVNFRIDNNCLYNTDFTIPNYTYNDILMNSNDSSIPALSNFTTVSSNYISNFISNRNSNIMNIFSSYLINHRNKCYLVDDPLRLINKYINDVKLNSLLNLNADENSQISINYEIPYYKFDLSNYTYKFIVTIQSYNNRYVYNNPNYEGLIFYNDTYSLDTILDSYQLSNVILQLNNNASNINKSYAIEINLSGNTVDNIQECLSNYRFNYVIIEESIDYNRDTDITIQSNILNVSNYALSNNYTYNSNIQTLTQGINTDIRETNSIFNSNWYPTNIVKSNCDIQLTSQSFINRLINYERSESIDSNLMCNYRLLRSYNEPEILYGKQDSNDSLRHYYILKMYQPDESIFYPLFSIKYYYGTLSNRAYKDKLYFSNSNLFCTYNFNIELVNVILPANITSYAISNNYQNLLGLSVGYQRLLSNVSRCSSNLQPLSPIFYNYIYVDQALNFTFPTAQSDYSPNYKKLLYTKNNLSQLANNYVFSLHSYDNLSNPDYVEYSINILDLQSNCTGQRISHSFFRKLTYNEVLQLSNNGYVGFFDNINIERNLSNCGINYNNLLSNTNFNGPLSGNLSEYIDLINEPQVLYRRYENRLGTVNYSYLISVNNLVIEYGIYFMYAPNSNCSADSIIWSGFLMNSNIANPETYAIENNYTSVISVFTQSQRMQLFNLTATNSNLINYIYNNLSNLRNNPTYSSNVLSLQYTKTDYTNLTNTYIVAYWPPETNVTLNDLILTSPNYIQYNLTLSNIQSANTYTINTTNIPSFFNIDTIDEYTRYFTNVYFKNGMRTNTDFYELSYSPSNCYSAYNASNLMSPILGLGIQSVIPTTVVDLGSDDLRGFVAFKNNISNRSYDYIAEILHNGAYYYPEFQVRLGNPDVLDSCSSYLESSAFNPTFIRFIPYNNLSNAIATGAYTSNINFTLQSISEGFNTFQQFTPKQNTYTLIMFESENSFKINDLKLYTFNDITIPIEIINQTNTNIFIKNRNNYIIKGYSFITNSYSSFYDPKSWKIKGTNDGRTWKILHSYGIRNNLPRNYQLPLMYLNDTIKELPQPISKIVDKPKSEIVDKEQLVKYYIQKINPSIKPEFKKYMRDNYTYYCTFDAYDLNKRLVGSDLIVGFVLRDGKVKKAILYETDEGNYVPFDMKKKYVKEFWDRNIMLPLLFNTSF